MSGLPSRWLEVRARSLSDPGRGVLLADALVGSLGGRAAEEVDGWYVTHVPAPEETDVYPARAEHALAEATGLEDIEVVCTVQDHENWAQTWKRGLHPRRVTPRLVVTPSWTDPHAAEGELVIVVDPGMAFGNAEHGTTRGCLRLLDGLVRPGDRVMDVGAGSGILSIAAAMLGAGSVLAVEGDALATETLAENIERNGVQGVVTQRDVWADVPFLLERGPMDGVVANIEAGPLTPLIPGLAGALGDGGWLVLSGILDTQWGAVSAAVAAEGLEPCGIDADGEWRSGVFR